ncbi:DNA polymerase III subunit beta [Thermus parvatiensis]|uniref:DNA polymerase III subunit beta n=1 Tax=Thermus parvatiensis TaxID=456163 RepID=A0A109QJR0_9DEIN|nr:nucleotidyltransferase family protein [Thermus parvatiensis]AMA75469.1 DNA polymerase III subunit beta [Thermus parvatiensis]
MALPTPVSPQALAELCQRYGVRRLLLFGSFARGEADEKSDVDLLVEFFPGRTPGLGFARLQEELTRLFGRRVDLHTLGSLSPYLREEVLREARPIHEAA